jgi:integrase
VRKAKGGRQRRVPIHHLFVDYLRVRADDPEPALLVGVQGRRLLQTIMTQAFLRYVRAPGVIDRRRVKPHTIRHAFASELLRARREPAPRSTSCSQVPRLDPALHARHLEYSRVAEYEPEPAVPV